MRFTRHTWLVLLVSVLGCAPERGLEELHRAGSERLLAGDLPAAEALAAAGLKRSRDPLWAWRFRVLRGEILSARGRHAEVLALLEDGGQRDGPPDAADVRARVATARARCVSPKGEDSIRRAEADLAAAESLATTLDAPELGIEVALCRGTCAAFGGDAAAAETRFREALAAARRAGRPFLEARAAGGLGWIRVRGGRYDDGAEWLGKSLALSSAAGAHATTVKTLHNLGWCYYRLGEHERALGFLARGQALAAERGFADDEQLIITTMGNAHYRMRDLARAAGDYARALAVARELQNRAQSAKLLGNLAIVALERGLLDEAQRHGEEAERVKRELNDQTSLQHSHFTSARILAARGDAPRAEALLREVIASPHTDAELAWETRAELAALLVSLGRPAEADGEFRAAFALMDRSRERLTSAEPRISFFASLRRFHDAHVGFLVDERREREALEVADRGRARQLRGVGPEAAPARVERLMETAAALPATLLFYHTAPARSFLWVVTPGDVALHVLPGAAELRARVEAHQARILRGRDPLAEGPGDADWLYETLVRPAAIRAGSRVIIAPDGPLHLLSFETLVVGERLARRYWLEDVVVATAPSLALLDARRAAAAPPPSRRLLVIGDPTPADPRFPPLPATADEVRRVAAQFAPGEQTVFTGAAADPSVYRRADPGAHAFIHFAAHAEANAEAPLDSAVILAARDERYKLYAREIADHPLRAELVTLSACRSAGARAYAGEGLVGLAWAFLGSGAQNVVAGLWDVADTSTPELMEELYRGLRRGLDPAAALHEAKLSFVRSGAAIRKPYYWAPFAIYTRGR